MPWGQKSNLRAQEKHTQTQGETHGLQGAQATTTKKKKIPSSPFAHLGAIIQKKSAASSRSTLKKPQKALSTTMSVGVSHTKSCKGAKSKSRKKPNSTQVPPSRMRSRRRALSQQSSIVVQFLMHKYRMKKPITKTGMLKIINKKYENHFREILKRASFSMEVVFGVDLKEVDSTKNSYVLVSKMDLPNNGTVSRGMGLPKTGLLMSLLGVIFMKGNCATEEKIWEFLNKMRIYAGKRHFIFGEPRKLITQDFVKLKYLEYRQVPNSDPARYEFLWGPRAHAETSKMRVLEYLSKINNMVPSAFQFWYEEALRDEKERAQGAVTCGDSTK
ncbi:melanoma-associated antigen B3 [Tupaia chinensis]|nr:melanoma-associated antigen B3 [Tupaia chinensis]XP_006158545.1 melanoma-associated antigen B3 [Tupaia chinensis]